MHTVLAIAIGSNDMTVATYNFEASVDVSVVDSSVVGASVHIGDDARVLSPAGRVGDPVPIFLPDGRSATGAQLVADTIAELAGRRKYDAVVVVHPVTWTRYAVSALENELSRRSVVAAVVNRPSVADRWLRGIGTVPSKGQAIVVEVGEDDTVVSCCRAENGRTVVVTEPGSDPFGAVSVDRTVLAHIVGQLRKADPSIDPADPSNWNDLHELAQRVSAARHRLDTTPVVDVDTHLHGVHRTMRIVRSEFEELIVADVVRMASRVAGTVAQFSEPVQKVVVHGAAASIPMVAEAISVRTRAAVVVATTPDATVIKGAILWASGLVSPIASNMPTIPIRPTSIADGRTRRSIWTKSRVWMASGAAAVLLGVGGFVAAHAVTAPEPVGPAPVPTMHTVGANTPGP
ncbi:Hsp70 family protein [Rhodococcoides kyotonense]|uniref:Hsp70 protein n=1 Tax=Rhodococcoides kyotonense TaxID=398843 RepID=A0A239LLH4_9NOCA|nr:Hsp70 family protein [Rhodococcus kyotonensis]SNT31321.1 Hsp70 protein [Rhodococcus kyotonensis]